jgi:hypothetical protein
VPLRCTSGLGRNGIVTALRCHADAREVQRERVRWCTGTARALWALWVSQIGQNGVARVGCTVGLGVFCLGESILCVEASLTAR